MASALSRRSSFFQTTGASTKATSLEAFQEILEHHDRVVVFCYEKYCLFCKLMAPVFESIAMTPSFEGVHFVRVNLKKQKEISARYNVSKYPMIMYFSRAREVVRFLGARKKEEFEDSLQDAINSTKSEGQSTVVLPTAEGLDVGSATYCQGSYEDRPSTISLFSDQSTPFDDLEQRCLIRPAATEEETLTQIARANEGKSYFAVHLWNKPKEDSRKIFFRLDFINDGPLEEDRFQSAMFQVTFAYDQVGQSHLPLSIVDIFPTCAEQLVSHTVFDADLGIDLESENTSPGDSSKILTPESPSLAIISGQGKCSPTAAWNFVEADGQGLDAHYLVSASLPRTSKISMKIYGKAVHIRRRGSALGKNRVVLKVGSLEKPYERILDLTDAVLQSGPQSTVVELV